jgi:hypothetical protein
MIKTIDTSEAKVRVTEKGLVYVYCGVCRCSGKLHLSVTLSVLSIVLRRWTAP